MYMTLCLYVGRHCRTSRYLLSCCSSSTQSSECRFECWVLHI